MRPRASSAQYVWATRASLLRAVTTRGTGQLLPAVRVPSSPSTASEVSCAATLSLTPSLSLSLGPILSSSLRLSLRLALSLTLGLSLLSLHGFGGELPPQPRLQPLV